MSLTRIFLPQSGPISMETAAGSGRSIVERFGGARTHRMSEYYGIGVNTANATLPESGPLRFSDFYSHTEMITTSRLTAIPGPGLGFFTPGIPPSTGQTGGFFFQQTQAGFFRDGQFNNSPNNFQFPSFIPGQGNVIGTPGQPGSPGFAPSFTQTQPGTVQEITEFLTRVAPEPGA